MVRVTRWIVFAVACFALAPAHAGGHRELDAYQRAYGWYAPGQYVHDDHRYEHGAHGIAWRGTEQPAWRWCAELGAWVRVAEVEDSGIHRGIDPSLAHGSLPRHLR
jgi:hypothetical protein